MKPEKTTKKPKKTKKNKINKKTNNKIGGGFSPPPKQNAREEDVLCHRAPPRPNQNAPPVLVKIVPKSKVVFWNKGSAAFKNRKDEVERLIEAHTPILLGLVEANIQPACHPPTLQVEGYWLELDDLHEDNSATRTALFIQKGTKYKRRRDLEPPQMPVICVEINHKSKKPWLAWLGYREWESSVRAAMSGRKSMADQVQRLSMMTEAWGL